MARVGVADYHHSTHGPNARDKYWREVIDKGHWDHPFHSLREGPPKPHYRDICPSSLEASMQPWALLNRSFAVGRDDQGASYLDSRQVPRGLGTSRGHGPGQQLLTGGEDPRRITAHSLQRGLRASHSSGALALTAKPPGTARSDLAHAGRERLGSPAASVRSRSSSAAAAGWAGPQQDFGGREPPRSRMPSFNRIYNA